MRRRHFDVSGIRSPVQGHKRTLPPPTRPLWHFCNHYERTITPYCTFVILPTFPNGVSCKVGHTPRLRDWCLLVVARSLKSGSDAPVRLANRALSELSLFRSRFYEQLLAPQDFADPLFCFQYFRGGTGGGVYLITLRSSRFRNARFSGKSPHSPEHKAHSSRFSHLLYLAFISRANRSGSYGKEC